MSDRPTLMQVTFGITEPNLAAEPLATEGEATPGDDSLNPYESPEDAERVEEIESKQNHRRDSHLFKTGRPTAGNDPYAFDDLSPSLPALGDDDLLGIETVSPFTDDGPEW